MGYRQNLRPTPNPGTDTVDITEGTDTLTDTDTDTTEESGLLMLNPKQKLKPHLGTDTDTDTTEENDLLMPNLQLMPKLSHGTMLDTTGTHTLMGDTDTHMLITTLERDLLMLNQKLKVSHGMDM